MTRFSPGQRLGVYELIAPIGRGGMGEVWRALDPALRRHVAIKVLPQEYSRDPDRLRRFTQEAQAAGMLNHPNVLAIYAIGEQDESPYLVTELLEGQTLRERLMDGPVAEAKALDYGDQIVQGLAAAHQKGIVHRDLKPENIFVTTDGIVKILDFGLAKLAAAPAGDDAVTQTALGVAVGTPAYMSPEQVRGQTVDHRADVFAAGAVLYETLAGCRAFSAETSVETMNAILNHEPPPLVGVSPQVEQIVRHCLEKAPADRFQSARDLGFQLRLVRHPSTPGPATRHRRPAVLAALAGVIVIGVAGVAVWWFTRSADAPSEVTFKRLTFDSGLTTDPALSPDGQLMAYASDRAGAGNLDIWRQQIATGEAIRLTSHPADESEPSFSPDGSRLAFRSERDGGGIYVVSAFGGEPRLIAREGRRPRFSPDGTEIAYWVATGPVPYIGKSFTVPAVGGTPTPIAPSFASVRYPVWAPDGKRVMFVGARDQKDVPTAAQEWWIASKGDAPAVRTGAADVFKHQGIREQGILSIAPSDWTGNYVYFSAALDQAISVWRVAISPETGLVSGNAERLTSGTSVETKPSVTAAGGLVFASLKQDLNIWSLPMATDGTRPSGELQQVTGSAFDAHTSLSADGKLVFISARSGNRDVWMKDLVSGAETALTASPAIKEQPEITADGARVAYIVLEGSNWSIYQIASGGGVPEKLCDDCGRPWDWSPDGRRLLYLIPEGATTVPGLSFGIVDVPGGAKSIYLQHPRYSVARARFSPDGRWISFTVFAATPNADAALNRIVIAPFHDRSGPLESEWIVVAEEPTALDKARWSPDGNLLYYVSEADGFRCIRARRLDPTTKMPIGPPIDVYHSHSARRSLMNPWLGSVEISISPDKMFFNLGETTGSIWSATWK
jgi:serine/threonine protein kinase